MVTAWNRLSGGQFGMARFSNLDTRFRNLLASTGAWDIGCGMALPPSSPHRPRTSAGVVLASVQRENGRRAKGKLHSVSLTGGTLRLGRALGEGDFVEVAFQTLAGKVAGLAEMLNPVQKRASRRSTAVSLCRDGCGRSCRPAHECRLRRPKSSQNCPAQIS